LIIELPILQSSRTHQPPFQLEPLTPISPFHRKRGVCVLRFPHEELSFHPPAWERLSCRNLRLSSVFRIQVQTV